MKLILIVIAALAALSACKTVPPPDMCSELTQSVPGEEKIPKPLNAQEEKTREAMICAMRACKLTELVDLDYRGDKAPRIWYWVDQNQVGIGRCIYPKYYSYMGSTNARNSRTNNADSPTDLCPTLQQSVLGESNILPPRNAFEKIMRDATVCAVRKCKVKRVTEFWYEAQRPHIGFDDPYIDVCVRAEYDTFKKTAEK